MKRFHLALGVSSVEESVVDYSARLDQQPDIVIPNEYALWLHFSYPHAPPPIFLLEKFHKKTAASCVILAGNLQTRQNFQPPLMSITYPGNNSQQTSKKKKSGGYGPIHTTTRNTNGYLLYRLPHLVSVQQSHSPQICCS